MKKFLSLVLALVMTMSLVTIGAGATEYKNLSDKDEIKYEEAVAVLNKLGIITGYEDGSFRPTGALTRGAAAKIIVSLMIGSEAASNLTVAAAPYSDVPVTNTFAAVISYCKTAGYINGYADGTFRPTGALTGYAFAKMLLGALGYDGAIEGFTGSGWTMNVAKIGNLAGLFDGISGFSGNAGIDRETACQLALNTLKADEVEYNGDNINVTAGNANVSITNSRYSFVENKVANDYRGADDGDNRMQFCEEHFSDLKLTDNDANDDFGRPAMTWSYKKSNVGTYATLGDQIATYEGKVTMATMYSLLGSSTVSDLGSTTDLVVWNDGVDDDTLDGSAIAAKNNSAASCGTGKGAITEVYKNGDGDVTVVVINTYLVQAAADYNSSRETLTINSKSNTPAGIDTSISNDDFAVSGFKADDYILITVADGDIKSVKAAETVSGTVSAYVNNADGTVDTVTIAGTKYSFSAKATTETKESSFAKNEDATVILDTQGNILFVDEATASSKNFVYISDFAPASGLATKAIAQAYFSDGTSAEITVKKLTTTAGGTAITDAGDIAASTDYGWYTYSKDSSDKYTLTFPKDYSANDTGATTIANGAVVFATGLRGNASTVFVVLDDDDDVTVYTGIANVPDVTGTVVTTAAVKSGYAKYVFVDASDGSVDVVGVDNSDLLYILEDGKSANNGDYYTYVALVNGEKLTIESTKSDFAANTLYYNVRTNADGQYTYGKAVATGGDQYDDGTITAATITHTSGVITITADAVDLLVNSSTKIVVVSAAAEINKDANADYEVNTYVGTSGAEAIETTLASYDVTGTYQVINTSSTSGVAATLYIYVESVA